jgi:hypothetical protein
MDTTQELARLLASSGVTLPMLRANQDHPFTLFVPNSTALASFASSQIAAQNATTPDGVSSWLRSPAGRATLLTHVYLGDANPYEWGNQDALVMASGTQLTVSKYDSVIELWAPFQASHARLTAVDALKLGGVRVHVLDCVLTT